MAWLEISSTIPPNLEDKCAEIFENLGAVSVSLFDASNQPLLEPLPGTTPLWEKIKIVGLFPEETHTDFLIQSLKTFFPTLTFSSATLSEQDWTRTWLQYFEPMNFGEKLWISPTDHPFTQREHPDKIIVKLDPGLAFGTGTHPTTALCLKWLDKHPPLSQTILDYGCGSGILAIAALKLGAQRAIAVDYDTQALIATHENAKRNKINENSLLRLLPNELPDIQAQTLLANILAQPLIQLAPKLSQLCAFGGHIVLSGLLTKQINAVQSAYAPWFEFDALQTEEEWVLLAGSKVK